MDGWMDGCRCRCRNDNENFPNTHTYGEYLQVIPGSNYGVKIK